MLISALLSGWKCTRAGFLNSLEAVDLVPNVPGLLDAASATPQAPKVRHACKLGTAAADVSHSGPSLGTPDYFSNGIFVVNCDVGPAPS
jgi:hypothetical protein